MQRFLLITFAVAAALHQTLPGQTALNQSPSRVVGQPSLTFRSASPNVVEGREFYAPYDIAVDRSSDPPVLYVSDLGNNRVLGWRNASAVNSGAQADIVVGQLDFTSTNAGGPGTSRSLGLSNPTGIAVDRAGNLYILDAGNNRILRFPRPMDVPSNDLQIPDLVIGQPNLQSSTANNGGISEKTLSLSSNTLARSSLRFDPQGNLWVTDSLNNRVLRFSASALAEGVNQPAADLVLGQPDFMTGTTPAPTNTDAQNKTLLRSPSALMVDNDNRVYVADTLGRVLVYVGPYFNGREAVRILGVTVSQPGQPTPYQYSIVSVGGLFMFGNRPGVTDNGLNRIIIYDAPSDWPPESATEISPPARILIGQAAFNQFNANRNLAEPSESTLSAPGGAFWSGTELFVADSGNNRVLVFSQVANNASATKVLGQPSFNLNAPNHADAKGLYLFNGFGGSLAGDSGSDGAGIAIDTRAAAPYLYIADTYNNRVLGYRDARLVRPGDRADIVIGQADFERTQINAPFNTANNRTSSSLFRPSFVAVDANGDLWVADSGNSRVLRFPQPFSRAAGERQSANLVIGQLNFTSRITDPTSRTMAMPVGIAFTFEGHLLVADAAHSRVLFFRKPANGDFVNGQLADRVIGQPDFFTSGRGSSLSRLSGPRGIATDTDDRLYVADAGNSRVQIYDRITVGANDPAPAFTIAGLNTPQAVWVSSRTGEIWVANSRGNSAVRYPRFDRLAISSSPDFSLPSAAPLGLAQDTFGNLYVAEGVNRIAMFYNAMTYVIAGNFAQRPLSPGTVALLNPPSGGSTTFADASSQAPDPPLPTELGDVQVLLNDKPLPLFYVGPQEIKFQTPMSAPESGFGELQVVRKSTGQILAVTQAAFAPVSPALFIEGGAAAGQLLAQNDDGSNNSPTNPIARGRYLSLYGTGLGVVPDAPPDGVAPTERIPVPSYNRPRVYLGGKDYVNDEDIRFAGLIPGQVGVWLIEVKVPDDVAPGTADAFVVVRSTPSNRTANGVIIRTTYQVKP